MKISLYLTHFSYFFSGLALACLTTLTPATGNATTYYVATTGNDSNPGTEHSPFRNINHGVTKLSAGDTLYVKSGTYTDSILTWKTKIPNGTSWNNPVTVSAMPGETVTINPPEGLAFFWVKDGQAKYLIINGFIVDGKRKAIHGFKFSDNARYIRVTNTEVKNTTESAILVTVNSGTATTSMPVNTYHEFINMNVHDNGSSGFDHGFYVSTSYNLFENVEVHHNSGFGIHLYMSKLDTVHNNTVRHSSAHNNGTLRDWACGVLLSSGKDNVAYSNIAYKNPIGFCSLYRSTNAQFYNNIAYENTIAGVHVGDTTNVESRVYNNTTYKNGKFGVFVGDGAKNSEVQNNIGFENDATEIYLEPSGQTGTTVSHNLTEDPKFMNASMQDFHLKEGSSAIDGGLLINHITTDYDGDERSKGSAPDIGAYESSYTENDDAAPTSPGGVILF